MILGDLRKLTIETPNGARSVLDRFNFFHHDAQAAGGKGAAIAKELLEQAVKVVKLAV